VAVKKVETTPQLKELVTKVVEITIEGVSPLIMHKWDEKVKQQMLDKQMKKTVVKEAKDPQASYLATIYHHPEGGYGFPANGLKACAIRGGKGLGVVMTDARNAFHIDMELVKIDGDPIAREDIVRLETGVPDIRYRAQFEPWASSFDITYSPTLISIDQLINMFQSGGFGVGLGEWRPENGGRFGRFRVTKWKDKGESISPWSQKPIQI
jgi:hypothetical protein